MRAQPVIGLGRLEVGLYLHKTGNGSETGTDTRGEIVTMTWSNLELVLGLGVVRGLRLELKMELGLLKGVRLILGMRLGVKESPITLGLGALLRLELQFDCIKL